MRTPVRRTTLSTFAAAGLLAAATLPLATAPAAAGSHPAVGAAAAGSRVVPAADVPPPPSGRTLTVGPGKQYTDLQDAADAAQPGDNVAITPGSYPGGLHLARGGSQDRYVTFYGDGGAAVLTDGGGDDGLLGIGDRSWVRFVNVTSRGSDGFAVYGNGASHLDFQNVRVDGSRDGGLVLLGSHDVRIAGCEISGTNARGTDADHEAMSLGEGSSDIDVSGCTVHDNGEEGIDVKYDDAAHITVHDSVAYANRGPNIYVDGSSDVDIHNNTVHGTANETKAGIGLAVEDYGDTRRLDNVRVYNNISYGNAAAGLDFWVQSDGAMSNVRIVNNTFWDNRGGAISFNADGLGGTNLVRNNIFGGGKARVPDATVDHNATGDPGFADPDGADFHLKPSSSAVDAGEPDGAPAFDHDNAPRPAGKAVDIGAYER